MKCMLWAVPMVLMSPEGEGGGAGGSSEGANGGAGGDGDKGGGEGDKTLKTIPLETHKALLDKFHAQNEELKALNASVQKIKDEEKARSTKTNEDKGDFKSLYESTKQELTDFKQKHDQFKLDVINTSRYAALESALKTAGLKQGGETVIDFADMEKMPFETTSRGRILVHGAEEMADALKKQYPYLFGKPVDKINTGGGAGAGGGGGDDKVTALAVLEAEDAARKDPKKKGDYEAVYRRYVEQQKQTRI